MEQGVKRASFEQVKSAHEIAGRLYQRDKERYQECFSWINKKVRQERSLALIVRAMKALESRAERNNPPVGTAFEYLEGTLRKMEEEELAKTIRQNGATMGEMLGPVIERFKDFKKAT